MVAIGRDMNNKLSHALHYLIYLAQERNWDMGAIKLLKSVVLSDVAALFHRQRTITGGKIVKAPLGPVPARYEEHLDWLVRTGRISIKAASLRYESTTYASLLPPDLSCFDPQEMEIIAEIGETCCKKYTASALSRITHGYFWNIAGMGEEIPLTAYLPTEEAEGMPLEPEEIFQLDAAIRQEGLNWV